MITGTGRTRRLLVDRRVSFLRTQDLLGCFQGRCMTHSSQTALLDENHSIATKSLNCARVHNSLLCSDAQNGCVDYVRGWAWQQALLSRRLNFRRTAATNNENTTSQADNYDKDCLLLWEHAPVYTLGRGADVSHLTFISSHDNGSESVTGKYHALSRTCRGEDSARLVMNRAMDQFVRSNQNVMQQEEVVDTLIGMAVTCPPVQAPNQVPIYRVERGGEVTYHGPGQLVVYPLLDLKSPPYQPDLHWYVRSIEQVIIECLGHYNIEGTRDPENTGVWVGDDKVAAVGVSASRWITTHGFALNVCPDLQYFDTSVILPCGIPQKGVTSMAQLLQTQGENRIPPLSEVASVVLESFEKVFGVALEPGEALR